MMSDADFKNFEAAHLSKIDELNKEIARTEKRGAELERIARKWPVQDGMPALIAWVYLAGYSFDLWRLNRRLPLHSVERE